MPSREILERGISCDARSLRSEIDGDLGGDIRDREPIARDERLVADLRVEPLKLLCHGLALRLAVFRKLFEPLLEQLIRMLERASVQR